ncbi:MAG: hypothetical protein JW818_17390 [Pirellulales bacterium]|nr:hypothetical protein [Pirellulales bacterium]
MSDWHEVVGVIERLREEFADLTVRGLRTVGPGHLTSLEALREEFLRISADHLAGRIGELVEAIRNDDRGSAAALMRAQASLRLFERMLSQEVGTATLETMLAAEPVGQDAEAEESQA